ncbi:hypothetical protein [Mesorhizobium sp.]|uniref:hypothetical protein n=1 Tax=Mesorhizobium sp. TaxID=1871066 RepID=UPI0025C73578|nr:hypothetical protein [Mesorhizobium sp.]
MKAVTPSAGLSVYLTEGAREGLFWAVNGSIPYSDPSEGVFVASNTAGWYWERRTTVLNPAMFGASLDPTVDSAVAIQAMFDFVRLTYSFAAGRFLYSIHDDRAYMTTVSINGTTIQQPNLQIGTLSLIGKCTGKIVLDMAGWNTGTIDDIRIYGDKTNQPAVGLLLSRTKVGGVINGAVNATINGGHISGYFSKAAYVQFACEVSGAGPQIANQSRAANAKGYINCGHAGTLDDYIGGLTSDYATIPVAADGSQSNILHDVRIPAVMMGQDVYLNVISISKANPAVVTVDPTALASSGLANGDKLFGGEILGMTQLQPGTTNPSGVYTIAGINVGAGTFQLSGIDATGYGTFTSGHFRNQTGIAVVLNGCAGLTWDNFYTLSYGNPGVVLDNKNGIAMRDISLGFQHEPTGLSPIRIDHPATAVEQEIPGLEIDLLNQFQTWTDCIISSNGNSGWTKLTNAKITVRMLTGAVPPNKVFGNPAKFNLNAVDIRVPTSGFAQDFTATPGWGGGSTPDVTFKAADDPRQRRYGGFLQAFGDAPRVSTNRPFNSGALGVYDWVGLNSSGVEVIYGFMRGRIVVNTAGVEYGRTEFVYKVAGVDTIAYFVQGQLMQLQAASLGLMTGTAGQAPLVWAAGTNRSATAAGEWEFDGKAWYASPYAQGRHGVTMRQIAKARAVVALSNSATTAQAIFQAANDVLTLPANTSYRFRAKIGLDTGATSHTTAFGLGGTAVISNISYSAMAVSSAGAVTAGTPQMTPNVATAAATVLAAASTAVRTELWIEGTFEVTTAGTIIPQVTFSAGPTGTCQTSIGSFFEVEPIGPDTTAAVGNWN